MSKYATKNDVLVALAAGEINATQAGELLDALNPKAAVKGEGNEFGVTYSPKLSPSGKGNVCVYSLQRMPVTLYGEQWERLLTEGMPTADKLAEMAVKAIDTVLGGLDVEEEVGAELRAALVKEFAPAIRHPVLKFIDKVASTNPKLIALRDKKAWADAPKW